MTPFQLRQAALCLRAGGIVAYPTEAVWGLGCNPLDQLACERLLQIKQRDPAKGLIIIGHSWAQLLPLVGGDQAIIEQKLSAEAARPTSWLVPAARWVPHWITGGSSQVVLRMTRHRPAAALCQEANAPIVSTSANISGMCPARSLLQARKNFGQAIDAWLPGPLGDAGSPSQIRCALTGRILRD